MPAFLLLGVIWAAVLLPPWLQSRREAQPTASMVAFRRQLWSLARTSPGYRPVHTDASGGYEDDDAGDPAGEVDGGGDERQGPDLEVAAAMAVRVDWPSAWDGSPTATSWPADGRCCPPGRGRPRPRGPSVSAARTAGGVTSSPA